MFVLLLLCSVVDSSYLWLCCTLSLMISLYCSVILWFPVLFYYVLSLFWLCRPHFVTFSLILSLFAVFVSFLLISLSFFSFLFILVSLLHFLWFVCFFFFWYCYHRALHSSSSRRSSDLPSPYAPAYQGCLFVVFCLYVLLCVSFASIVFVFAMIPRPQLFFPCT